MSLVDYKRFISIGREDEISLSAPMLGSRRFGRWPMTSGLPLETDIVRTGRHVSKVPKH